MAKISGDKLVKFLPISVSLPLCLILLAVKTSDAFMSEHQDVALMASVIGSGAMNINHYFHSLGISCENRNSGFWKIIDQDRQKCMKVRDSASSRSYYEALPQGSFEKMCRNWKNNEICNINFARDLNDCLGGSSRGSDALEFMEAYVAFSCRDIRDTESQLLSVHTRRHAPPIDSPGVFKCFPEVNDRIMSCVKEDTFSTTLCSQFSTVEQCFSRFYNDYRNCNSIGVVDYLRDLFRSMSFTMKCAKDVVDQPPYPKPVEPHPPPPHISHNSKYNYVHQENDIKKGSENSIPLLPKPLSPIIVHHPNQEQQTYWEYLTPIESESPRPLPPPPNNNEAESPLGAWFNLQQQKFSRTNNEEGGPAWAWGYERYASPQTIGSNNDGGNSRDRFYSYRAEPRNNNGNPHLDRGGGVYDLYQVHYDRYGMPPSASRGLSNRPNKTRKPKVIMVLNDDEHHSTLWDLHDNHFRKFKDDHMFQGEPLTPPQSASTPRIGGSFQYHPRFIHSVPTLSSTTRKRKVNVFLEDDSTTTEKDIGAGVSEGGGQQNVYTDYKITIISNTTVAPTTRRSSYVGVIPDIFESHSPSRPIANNGHYFRRVTTTQKIPFLKEILNEIHTPKSTPTLNRETTGYPTKVKVQPSYRYEEKENFPFPTTATTTISSTPKIFSFRPTATPGNHDQPKFPKFRPKNVTYIFPPWPRPRNTDKLYGVVKTIDQEGTQNPPPSLLHFDSKHTVSDISQKFTDLDLEENAYPQEHQSTTPSMTRPKILRKIKVRKRPIITSTIPTTTDY